MRDLQGSRVEPPTWQPYVVAACFGNLIPAAELVLPQGSGTLVGLVAAVGLGVVFPLARSAGLALALHFVPSFLLLAFYASRSATTALVVVGSVVAIYPLVWAVVALAQKARRGLYHRTAIAPDPTVKSQRTALVFLLVGAAVLILGGSIASRMMNDDVDEAVVQKLQLIRASVQQVDAKMTTTQVADTLRANGLRFGSIVGSGDRFAFSLPVERALARRCINVLVNRGTVATKVFYRPCHPNDPGDAMTADASKWPG